MKNIFNLLFIVYSLTGYSQNIFDYEREISNKENFNFQEIDFQNIDEDISLSGTLITPKSDFSKIVIIVPGSGKDTRYTHFILAEELLKSGNAVFRFDERGIGKSEGEYSELATGLSNDLRFAIYELQKGYSDKKFGVIGHSLGGIATLMAIEKKIKLDFIVFIETPIKKNGAFVINQLKMDYEYRIPKEMRKGKTKDEMILFLEGYFQVINESQPSSLKKDIRKYIKEKNFKRKFIVLLKDPFFIEMANVNLEEVLKESSIQTLYLTGTKDRIINHTEEISLVKSFNNPNIETHIFEDLNHWLTDRNGVVGSSLYQMDVEPLSLIIDWISKK